MDAKIKKCCPNCSQVYQLRSASLPQGNIPLFLSCGHSMCETCIKSIIKFEEPIECKICQRDMQVKASDVALLALSKKMLYQLFPINMLMLGELYYQSFGEGNTKKTPDNDHFINLEAILQNTDITQGQCLECHNRTSKMCKQCNIILCDACFSKSHKNFIIFKNHVLQNIEPVIEPNICKVHKGKPLDYYCQDCSKSVCMDCLMVGGEKSCKSHNVVSIQEVNETFVEELNEFTPKVDETFRRLTKTAVDIGNLLHNIENETGSSSELTNMLANIEQHFSKLSFKVQRHKQEVTDIIVKLKCSEQESLKKAKDNIAGAIKKAKNTLNTINTILNPQNEKKVNLAVLLDEAKSVANAPWYLTRDDSNDPLKVAVNEDLCSLISDYIHLEGNANSVYKLRPISELSSDVQIPPPPVAPVFPPELPKDVRQQNQSKVEKDYAKVPARMFYKNVPKYRCKSGSITSLNSLDSDSSLTASLTVYGDQKPVVQQVQPFAESKHPKQLHEGSQELIYITHIVDPHNFFVQRACHQPVVKEMLREFRNSVSLPKPFMNHVAEGKLYLVFNKADNMWQRCRVVSIDKKSTTTPTYHVFCIDFGSTEQVSIDQMRLLPPARVQSPVPLALKCSLANVRPKTGFWSSDDSYLIQNIVDNKQAIVHVRYVRSTSNYAVTLECDVTTFDYGISLTHALVFHERGIMINPRLPYPHISGIEEKPKLYMNNEDYKAKSTEEVYITYILSPDKFYVRKRHLKSVFTKLSDDLEQEYSLAVNTGGVFLPEIGMVCVVSLERYQSPATEGVTWARALVSELPGRGRVRLLLPDVGISLLVHWTALRHINHKFTTVRSLATECHLAGVTPIHKSWSLSSVALLEKYTDRLLELRVEDTRRGSVGVTLYDNADEDNIVCINYEMIKYKFAISFGLFKFDKIKSEDQVFTNKSPLDMPKNRHKRKNDEFKILKRETALPETVDEKELEAKDKGPLRLEAKLLYYQSPSLLYVSLVHQQKAFNELFEKIQKHFSIKKTQGKDFWSVGDRCCAFCIQSQTWRRALIAELEGEMVKVFYFDFAYSETVPIASLRELTTEFASIGDAAIKCHLCGVASADGEDWPTITKEFLKELLDAYPRVFITKLGNFKDKSMPVELWVYHTIQGGALEANKSEWRCLNKKIIEQGLAVPDKTQQGSASDASATDDDMLSFLKNVTGSVHEWLQLEPLPTKPLITKSESDTPMSPISQLLDSEEDMNPEQSSSNTVFISDWLPPEPLQSKEFTGLPTYVDHDGVIYLHDISQQGTLDLLRKALDVRFKAPDPKAKYTKWNVGEPCVALFFLDNRFYRGRVLEVNNDNNTCIIHYVDYGNEEICSFENLRKSIAVYQIPIQAHRCVLNRIHPVNGQWDRQTLDYIHKSVVEKQCFVKIAGDPINGVLPIELKYDKLWINDHLVDFEMATYTDGSKAIVRKFAPVKTTMQCLDPPTVIESDFGPDYIVDDDNACEDTLTSKDDSFDFKSMEGKDWNQLLEESNELEGKYITFPKNELHEFTCNITIINELKILQLNVIHNELTNILYEKMYESIQQESEHLPPLNGVFENKACVALYHEDDQWYRASILQYSESENKIKVKYIDYGNIDVLHLSDVREIKDDWVKLLPANIPAALYGIQVNPGRDVNSITQEFADTFLDKGPFYAKVIEVKDSLPYVEIRNDDGDLIYEKLIEKEIFIKSETTVDD